MMKKKNQDEKMLAVIEILKDCEPPEYHRILNAAARKRPWRPRRKGLANLIDQGLHALYGALLLLPVILIGSFSGAALMGLLAGGIREVEQFFNQDLRIRMFWDRVLDTSSFAAGAVILYYIIKVLR